MMDTVDENWTSEGAQKGNKLMQFCFKFTTKLDTFLINQVWILILKLSKVKSNFTHIIISYKFPGSRTFQVVIFMLPLLYMQIKHVLFVDIDYILIGKCYLKWLRDFVIFNMHFFTSTVRIQFCQTQILISEC